MAAAASTSCASPLLLPSGPRRASTARLRQGNAFRSRARSSEAACCCRVAGGGAAQCGEPDEFVISGGSSTRRSLLGVAMGASAFGLAAFDAVAGGLPPEEKPKLCDAACESELENVPMVTTESGLQYKDIKVGEGPSPPVGFQLLAGWLGFSFVASWPPSVVSLLSEVWDSVESSSCCKSCLPLSGLKDRGLFLGGADARVLLVPQSIQRSQARRTNT